MLARNSANIAVLSMVSDGGWLPVVVYVYHALPVTKLSAKSGNCGAWGMFGKIEFSSV